MKHINVALFVPHLGCPHNCIFCDQRAISGVRSMITREEIENACRVASKTPHDINNSEIAFFGGSFTAVDRDIQKMCLETASRFVGSEFGGIRISTRPDCIDGEELDFLKSYGVTAIELGAQSMFQSVLDANERGHSPEDTVRASALIKERGFSLGLQMMTGLYGSDGDMDRETARRFIELRPDTVRIYPTVVLKNTRLMRLYEGKKYIPPDFDETAELCAELLQMFRSENIKVIRLGLHSGGGVGSDFAAGVYHPAFGEICESIIFRKETEKLLSGRPGGFYRVTVNPADISKAVGQKKSNILFFRKKGYYLTVSGSVLIEKGSVEVAPERN